jgi:hypothetical protein
VEEEDASWRGGGGWLVWFGGLGWLGWRVRIVGDLSMCGGDVSSGRKMMSECLGEKSFRRSWD